MFDFELLTWRERLEGLLVAHKASAGLGGVDSGDFSMARRPLTSLRLRKMESAMTWFCLKDREKYNFMDKALNRELTTETLP